MDPLRRAYIEQHDPELLDAIGVPLALGQRVVYATARMYGNGRLTPGTVVWLRRLPVHDRVGHRPERIGIRRDDGQHITLTWSKRVLVLRQESEADGWLRRQLAALGAR